MPWAGATNRSSQFLHFLALILKLIPIQIMFATHQLFVKSILLYNHLNKFPNFSHKLLNQEKQVHTVESICI